MKKYLLLRKDGRVAAIMDAPPKDAKLEVKEVDVTEEEEKELLKAKTVSFKGKRIAKEEFKKEPDTILTILEKLRTRKATLPEVQEVLQYILESK